MMFKSMAAATLVLAASTGWAQMASTSSSNSHPVAAINNAAGLAENARAQSSQHKRVEDMGNTLSKMHALLKEMAAKNVNSKDPMVKANMEMWGLLLADLDKQYEQMKLASHTREDMEARRSAMYKQAEAKAALEAQMAKSAAANKAAAASQSSAPAAAQPAATPTAPASSPN